MLASLIGAIMQRLATNTGLPYAYSTVHNSYIPPVQQTTHIITTTCSGAFLSERTGAVRYGSYSISLVGDTMKPSEPSCVR